MLHPAQLKTLMLFSMGFGSDIAAHDTLDDMNSSFLHHHRGALIIFSIGVAMAVAFIVLPTLHRFLGVVDRLGYPGMLVAGLMYGSGLTASIATVIFVDSPQHLNPIVVGLLGGIGAAVYDLGIFLFTRREAEHGWLATFIGRMRQQRLVPNWVTTILGVLILASPLPDELAAGLFGFKRSKVWTFFLLSFASNALGVFLLSTAV